MVQQPFSGMRPSFTSTNGLVVCIICFPQAAKLTKGDVLKGAIGVMPTIDPDSLMFGRQFNVNMGGIVIGTGIMTGETVLVGLSFSDVQALADLMAEQRE
jgi:hypothetical protein